MEGRIVRAGNGGENGKMKGLNGGLHRRESTGAHREKSMAKPNAGIFALERALRS